VCGCVDLCVCSGEWWWWGGSVCEFVQPSPALLVGGAVRVVQRPTPSKNRTVDTKWVGGAVTRAEGHQGPRRGWCTEGGWDTDDKRCK
jgi:hypothetical protein